MTEKTEDKKKAQTIHTSYVGEFKAGSLSVKDGVASATFTTAGGNDVQVKGYNAHAKTLQDAVTAGGEMIIRGSLLGNRDNKHVAIYGTGPEQISGLVSNVRHNFDSYEKDGKQPFVNMFVQVERGEHKIGRPVSAFGDNALTFKGVAEGDKMTAPARQTHESREVAEKGADEKSTKWVSTFRVEGPGTFEPAPAAEKGEAKPAKGAKEPKAEKSAEEIEAAKAAQAAAARDRAIQADKTRLPVLSGSVAEGGTVSVNGADVVVTKVGSEVELDDAAAARYAERFPDTSFKAGDKVSFAYFEAPEPEKDNSPEPGM